MKKWDNDLVAGQTKGDDKMDVILFKPSSCTCCREAWVELVCDQQAQPGKEEISTTGDSEVALVYVSYFTVVLVECGNLRTAFDSL